MPITNIHHVAYRCRDAQETVDFYTGVLGMPYTMAISEDRVPSTKEPDPYMHIFFDAGEGASLAFFELPTKPAMGRDPNTPDWVQHIAFQVKDEADLLAYKEKLDRAGIDVLGPTDHGIFKSIYFFDPNGHRVELAHHFATPAKMQELEKLAPHMLADWNRSKSTVKHAAFLHEKEFDGEA
jgi:glyoxylase I family protein